MLNYRHLYYFWMVAKEGGFARAADRLEMAVQTISAQVRDLEKSLGHQLLKPSGRGVALTEAGQALLPQARQLLEAAAALKAGTAAPQGLSGRCTVGVGELAVALLTLA